MNLEASIPAPRQPKKLPVVLSRAEVLHFWAAFGPRRSLDRGWTSGRAAAHVQRKTPSEQVSRFQGLGRYKPIDAIA